VSKKTVTVDIDSLRTAISLLDTYTADAAGKVPYYIDHNDALKIKTLRTILEHFDAAMNLVDSRGKVIAYLSTDTYTHILGQVIKNAPLMEKALRAWLKVFEDNDHLFRTSYVNMDELTENAKNLTEIAAGGHKAGMILLAIHFAICDS
jgi:hypothetical protein